MTPQSISQLVRSSLITATANTTSWIRTLRYTSYEITRANVVRDIQKRAKCALNEKTPVDYNIPRGVALLTSLKSKRLTFPLRLILEATYDVYNMLFSQILRWPLSQTLRFVALSDENLLRLLPAVWSSPTYLDTKNAPKVQSLKNNRTKVK